MYHSNKEILFEILFKLIYETLLQKDYFCTMSANRKGTQMGLLSMSASLLCAIHCISLPFLLSAGALGLTQFITNPLIEFSLIAISILFGFTVIRKGFSIHGKLHIVFLFIASSSFLILFGVIFHNHESLIGSLGGIGLAISLLLNWRASQ